MSNNYISKRFRGFLPVIVDVETGGFDPLNDALLEIALVYIAYSPSLGWYRDETLSFHVEPFENSNIDPKALEFNKIDPYHPFRFAKKEKEIFSEIALVTSQRVLEFGCSRAILVGHNAAFDIAFLNAAVKRLGVKQFPFHTFSTFDTATLAGVAYGQTVLARAMTSAGFDWDTSKAHSAIYDAEGTADLFCRIVNLWDGKVNGANS